MAWLMDGCFPLFYLLTYMRIGKIPENFPHSIFFSRKVTTLVKTHCFLHAGQWDRCGLVRRGDVQVRRPPRRSLAGARSTEVRQWSLWFQRSLEFTDWSFGHRHGRVEGGWRGVGRGRGTAAVVEHSRSSSHHCCDCQHVSVSRRPRCLDLSPVSC